MIPSSAASSDVAYAVWNSEEDFLANPGRPLAKYTSNVLTTEAVSNKGYVYCYSDVTITSQVTLNQEQHLILDLGGNTLITKSKLMVNGTSSLGWHNPGSVTIINGTVIHEDGQFIQPRPNSEIYFENVDVIERGKSNFIYDGASLRIVHFKDCTITVEGAGSFKMFNLAAAYSGEGADILYKNEEGKGTDYVRNIVFENTALIDNSGGAGYIVSVRGTHADFVNVSFIYGSSFNNLSDNFLEVLNDSAVVTVNVAKGARFASEEVPISASNLDVKFYDSIEVVNKHRVSFGKETDILTSGTQNPENPELIFGKSGDEKYPYQLCHYLCDVTWVIESEHVEKQVVTESGYADGLRLSYSATTGSYYTRDDKVYVENHMGWTATEGGEDYSETVTLVEKESTFYAVFAEFPVYAVEYSSADKTEIISGLTENVLTSQQLSAFKDGSYVYVYEDITWSSDTVAYLGDITLTIDLGGNTFYKSKLNSRESGTLELDGTSLTIKGGTVESSMTGFAALKNGAELVIEDATVAFDNYPAIRLESGNVTVKSSKINQNATDVDAPFVLFTLADTAEVEIESSEVILAGPLSTVIPVDGAVADAGITVTDCGTLYADSLFTLSEGVAGKIADGAEFSLTIGDTDVIAREMFDDCESKLEAEYSVLTASKFASKPVSENGLVVLPLGLKVIAIDDGVFAYTLAKDEIDVKFNMALSLGFTANFYISTDYPVTYTETYLGNTKVDDLKKVTIDGGEFYLVSVGGITVADAFDTINVRVGYESADGSGYANELAYDPTDYFAELLSDEDPLNRKLAAAAVNYIASAYEYYTAVLPEDAKVLLESDAYLDSLRDSAELPEDGVKTELGNLSLAFKSAQLYLSSDLYVRFNLNETFSGTLNLDGTVYTVDEGLCDGKSYIQLKLTAHALYGKAIEISGTASDGTAIAGKYSLMGYVAYFADEDALSAMLDAFYAYCYEAFVYDNGGVLPPYIDHTPPLDAELS